MRSSRPRSASLHISLIAITVVGLALLVLLSTLSLSGRSTTSAQVARVESSTHPSAYDQQELIANSRGDSVVSSSEFVAQAYGTMRLGQDAQPTATTPAPQPLGIHLMCIRRNYENNTFTAYWGYLNPNAYDVTVPVGSDNLFHSVAANQGQTTTFRPGRVYIDFNVPNIPRDNLRVWIVSSFGHRRTSTASWNAPECSGGSPTATPTVVPTASPTIVPEETSEPIPGPTSGIAPEPTATATAAPTATPSPPNPPVPDVSWKLYIHSHHDPAKKVYLSNNEAITWPEREILYWMPKPTFNLDASPSSYYTFRLRILAWSYLGTENESGKWAYQAQDADVLGRTGCRSGPVATGDLSGLDGCPYAFVTDEDAMATNPAANMVQAYWSQRKPSTSMSVNVYAYELDKVEPVYLRVRVKYAIDVMYASNPNGTPAVEGTPQTADTRLKITLVTPRSTR